MACPVVAGVAALILEHYPTLSAQQVKYVIENSTKAPKEKVKKPGTDDLVDMSDISKSGGIVNAYEAIKLAGTLNLKQPKEKLPKTKIRKTKLG